MPPCPAVPQVGTFEKMITPALEGDYRGHEFTLANSWKDIRYFAEFAESLGRKPTLVEVSWTPSKLSTLPVSAIATSARCSIRRWMLNSTRKLIDTSRI